MQKSLKRLANTLMWQSKRILNGYTFRFWQFLANPAREGRGYVEVAPPTALEGRVRQNPEEHPLELRLAVGIRRRVHFRGETFARGPEGFGVHACFNAGC